MEIDEKTLHFWQETKDFLSRVDERIITLVNTVSDLKKTVKNAYVSQHEFKPIKAIVYGMVGIILVGVLGALLDGK